MLLGFYYVITERPYFQNLKGVLLLTTRFATVHFLDSDIVFDD